MAELFSDDEGPSTHMLTINEHYAKAFEYRKEREELEKLKAKYGSDYDPDEDESTDSESAESEDEHGEELTPAVDAAILRTLAKIRKRDPEIYDSQKNIFGQEREKVETKVPRVLDGQGKPKDKSKPVTIKQVNLEAMLNPDSRSPSPEPLTHAQEQEALRRETIAAFHNAVPEGDEDDFLIPREKTQDEREREEEEYRAFLEREVGDLKDLVSVAGSEDEKENEVAPVEGEGDQAEEGKDKKKKKKKKKKKSKSAEGEAEKPKKSKAEEDQEFLMNYILNRGWIDRSEGHVPTYKEVTSESKERRKKKGKSKAEPEDEAGSDEGERNGENDEEDDPGLLSDTSFESVASFFETSYNHRFEEPGAATIPSFPRVLPNTVRREDTTRKDARERRKKRKEEELQKKREEVKRLKALKMREVKRKLELIGKQGGLKKTGGEGEDDDFVDEALRELDLEGEWDPEKHDRQMAGLFDRGAEAFEDEEHYDGEGEEQGFEDDDVKYDADGKPIWEDDIDIGDIPISDDEGDIIYGSSPAKSKKDKKKKKKKKKKDDDEDEGGVDIDAMDADVKPTFDDDEEWDGTEEMRKRKFEEYMDQIYGLEFNDLVGDMPTRFKYTKVQPQNFALTPAEILVAKDQELNEYMSVKKYAPYRKERGQYTKSAQDKLHELKAKLSERIASNFGTSAGTTTRKRRRSEAMDEHPHQGENVKKRKGKKERMRIKALNGDGEVAVEEGSSTPAVNSQDSKMESKKKKHEQDLDAMDVSDLKEGGEAAAAKKKRKRNRKKHGETAES
ncbi:hypothetical protein D9613_001050 [Agrocybe pediades]|uniref:Kri1-like C-terminal domain-containing protein n=1 Tax=Agrocybe pediades TaxID=84607 RepID=A0A8H4VUW5_9AGAR|nr:hypothetical protein D9613_001050 [Agrocybe pediades]